MATKYIVHSLNYYLIFVLLSINVTFTFYFLLFVDMFRPHTAIFRSYSILSSALLWQFFIAWLAP
jgi:hypothetical protein